MLEERSFLVNFNSKRDNTWGFMSNFRIENIESHQEKRSLDIEDEEIVHPTKARKQSHSYDNLDLRLGFHDLSLVPVDQPDSNQRHAGDDSDSTSLIHSIGRDNSISCLLKCSRSDYGSLASLNRAFRDLITNGELYRLRRKTGLSSIGFIFRVIWFNGKLLIRSNSVG